MEEIRRPEMSNEKISIKKLWERYPDARFVLWLDDYHAWFIKFEDPSWLEYPLYLKEFVPVCDGVLRSDGDIWIDLEDVDPQKKLRFGEPEDPNWKG
jgi:hypothetical protein